MHSTFVAPATSTPTAGETWPNAQAAITARALAGRLSDSQRREAEWFGFFVPAALPPPPPLYVPRPAPVTTPQDLAQLLAGAEGPATIDQVDALPFNHPLRSSYDNYARAPRASNYSVFAAGRAWYIQGHPFTKYADLSERTRANGARRAANETRRAALATKMAADSLPPLFQAFFGPAKVTKPRYTTAEEATSHTMHARQQWLKGMRAFCALQIRQIRAYLAAMDEATQAAVFTKWQRRVQQWGLGLVYLLEFLRRETARLAAEQPAS